MRTPTPKEDVMIVASSRRSGTPSRQFVARLMRAATLNVKEEQQWMWEHVVSKDWFASMFEDKANFSRQRLRTLVYASGMGYNANTQDALEAIQRRKERGFAGRGRRKMTPRLVQKDVNDIIGRSKGGLSNSPKPLVDPTPAKQDSAAARSAITDQADKLLELAKRFRSHGQGSLLNSSQLPALPIFTNSSAVGAHNGEGEGEGEGEDGVHAASVLAAAVAAATTGVLPNPNADVHDNGNPHAHPHPHPHPHAGGDHDQHHEGGVQEQGEELDVGESDQANHQQLLEDMKRLVGGAIEGDASHASHNDEDVQLDMENGDVDVHMPLDVDEVGGQPGLAADDDGVQGLQSDGAEQHHPPAVAAPVAVVAAAHK